MKNIIVTGANGYVGAMLINELLKKEDVYTIIGIDKDDDDLLLNQILERDYSSRNLSDIKKRFYFIKQNLDNKSGYEKSNDLKWQDKIRDFYKSRNILFGDVFCVHTAWQIRAIYGDKQKSWDWNVVSSQNVFDFSFANNISKLIYFSTVSCYGATKDNKIDYFYKETDPFRKSDYLYSEEKRITEENLLKTFYLYKKGERINGENASNTKDYLILSLYDYKKEKLLNGMLFKTVSAYLDSKLNSGEFLNTDVFVFRPAAITGPRGRFGRIRFGLQSALSGTLKQKKSFVYNIISYLTFFVPVTKNWLRQFVHEDDIINLVIESIYKDNNSQILRQYEVYNIAPPGECVLKQDMAKAVNKKMLLISPELVRVAFAFFWNFTRGKVPTSPGAWKWYSYPVAVSGEKSLQDYNYKYIFDSKTAFETKDGRYSFYCK